MEFLTDFVLVLTTLPVDGDATGEAAEKLARTLVDEHLAACVNILPPMRSIYSWKGLTEAAEERQLVIKTTHDRVSDLENRILELHQYDTPEFLVIPIVDGGREYLAWLSESTSKQTPQ